MPQVRFLTFAVLLSAIQLFAQQNQASIKCPATEQAVREVGHQFWAGYKNRDVAALKALIDDDAIATDDAGKVTGKEELLAAAGRPEGNIHEETDEQPSDFRVVFSNQIAVLNYAKKSTNYEKEMGISWTAASRFTMVLVCKTGKWRIVAFQETTLPNRDRKPSVSAREHLDDYVGRYRFGEDGDKGEFTVVRKGDTLLESWGAGESTELLPGKYDTFYSREDGWVERFVRDRSGKVTGILYTYSDGEFEAKRVP